MNVFFQNIEIISVCRAITVKKIVITVSIVLLCLQKKAADAHNILSKMGPKVDLVCSYMHSNVQSLLSEYAEISEWKKMNVGFCSILFASNCFWLWLDIFQQKDSYI